MPGICMAPCTPVRNTSDDKLFLPSTVTIATRRQSNSMNPGNERNEDIYDSLMV